MTFLSKISITLFTATLVVMFFAFPVKAAQLYFGSDKAVYEVGETSLASLKLDTENVVTNAVAATIKFDPNLIEVNDLVLDKSVINYWVQAPVINNDNGTIAFQGIILNPAFNGEAGNIISFNFKTKALGTFILEATDLMILAHDGQGTSLPASALISSSTIIEKPTPVLAIEPALVTPDETISLAIEANQKNGIMGKILQFIEELFTA